MDDQSIIEDHMIVGSPAGENSATNARYSKQGWNVPVPSESEDKVQLSIDLPAPVSLEKLVILVKTTL